MIYHFYNGSYGMPFRALATAYSGAHGVAITTVTSTKKTGRPNGLVHLLRSVRRAIDGTPAVGIRTDGPAPLEEIAVADVNAPAFLDRIQPGDVGIITGFNQIFSAAAIAKFSSLVNFHASLLPYYRGPTPAHWCLQNGERNTGFTIHDVSEQIDAGKILYQEIVPVDGIVEPRLLMLRIAEKAGPAFVRYLDHVRTGEPFATQVVDAGSVYKTKVNYRSFADRS
ncbi:MAG TPA: formyltransferase family protein [Candidatus Eremiobacteraceae bacterium]|nr:formyltransferase family protein [Candidatus Eremiobacteraceae bacterium]